MADNPYPADTPASELWHDMVAAYKVAEAIDSDIVKLEQSLARSRPRATAASAKGDAFKMAIERLTGAPVP